MITFFTKKKNQNLFCNLIDIHCHVLPSIDDGSENTDESIIMLEWYDKLNFYGFIPTPHIFKELYPNNQKIIDHKYQNFKRLLQDYNFNVKLLGYGAEYMLDEFFLEEIKIKNPLICVFKNFVLLEILSNSSIEILKAIAFNIQKNSYVPILAHPERYYSIKTKFDLIDLKNRGITMQLNALSLTGKYGRLITKKSREWLKLGLYDFISTDVHNEKDFKLLNKVRLKNKELYNWFKLKEKHEELMSNYY